MSPDDLERRFAAMLADAGLPRWESALHRRDISMLELTWDHGATIHFDLTRDEIDPIVEWDRRFILGIPPWGDHEHGPIHLS
jgi:hypothetical protein